MDFENSYNKLSWLRESAFVALCYSFYRLSKRDIPEKATDGCIVDLVGDIEVPVEIAWLKVQTFAAVYDALLGYNLSSAAWPRDDDLFLERHRGYALIGQVAVY